MILVKFLDFFFMLDKLEFDVRKSKRIIKSERHAQETEVKGSTEKENIKVRR